MMIKVQRWRTIYTKVLEQGYSLERNIIKEIRAGDGITLSGESHHMAFIYIEPKSKVFDSRNILSSDWSVR